MKFIKLLVVTLLLTLLIGGTTKAQDTTFTGIVTHDVGYSVTMSFYKDSTQSTVTNWFDITSMHDKYIYLSHTFTDRYFGLAANSDTVRCIIQVQDAKLNIFNADTIGTGSAGAEILVSTGTPAQYLTTLLKYGVKARLIFENVVTGTHKNGWGLYNGSLTFIPK